MFIIFNLLVLIQLLTLSAAFLGSFFRMNCAIDSFECSNGECISKTKHCDGQIDCKDSTDERDCDKFLCKPPVYFRCKNAECIKSTMVCDGESDCMDYSDEVNCGSAIPFVAGNCSATEWQCANKQCIPKEYVCNGNNDCFDHSDEGAGCTANLPCDTFRCNNGRCVPDEWRCDGTADCEDKSDEIGCAVRLTPKQCKLEEGHFLCADNRTCIKRSQVCDTIANCPDKSDENALCASKNSCATHNCSHDCVQLPTGPKCICPKGYITIDEKHCKDINECDTYGICDQKCHNIPGSYNCYCDNNYQLQPDNKTCKVLGGEAVLFFSAKKEIRVVYLETRLYVPILQKLKQAIGVAFDGHFIYWTDIYAGHESIVRAIEDGSEKEVLLTSGLGAPEDLAIDWLTGNIYFTDGKMQHIGVCNNDGTHCAVLVNKDVQKPRGIVLDPSRGEMYWTDWGTKPEIAKSNMDGSEDISFVSNNIGFPNGLAIDFPNERLYWTDAKSSTIESILLDGTDRRIVMEGIIKHPYGIAVFEDRLYWSDWSTKAIESCDKFTGKNHHTVVKEKKHYIYGVHVFHPILKPALPNPCAVAFCSHLCLLRRNGSTCACPEDKVLGADGRTCYEIRNKQMLIVGAEDILIHVHHQKLGRHDMTKLPVLAKNISCLAYDSLNNAVFISDGQIGKIFSYGLADDNVVWLQVGDFGFITAMDFDYLGNNLYWCDSERKTVEVFNFNTKSRKTILYDLGGEIPQSIALIPEEGVMFVALQKITKQGYHIEKLHMDGSGRTHTVEYGLLGPIRLHYDQELHRVFWSDAGTSNIESTSVDGDDRHVFATLHTSPISITSLNKYIFWVSRHSKKIYWADKSTDYNTKKITLDIPENTEISHIVSVTPKRIKPHACRINNGNCSHLCLLSLNSYICACPLGMKLQPDNKTCHQPTHCQTSEFSCFRSNTCILKGMRCNGRKDCLLGEDEENCEARNLCPEGFFQCKIGTCVKQELVCDLHYDCADRSDEENCDSHVKSKCTWGDFRCTNGRCISSASVCDGIPDCQEGEDEMNCETNTCGYNQFRCNSGTCIPKNFECDGDADCVDLSDEHSTCFRATCASNQFTCGNRKCLDAKLTCDGADDCGDASDEMHCDKSNGCRPEEFSCGSLCLPSSVRCNGTAECPSHEDEEECSDCQGGEFECKNGKCIANFWVCDSTDDCGDNSDEAEDLCKRPVLTPPLSPQVPCTDGFRCKTGHCINITLLCNGEEDCYDGSDEQGVCETSCQYKNNPCEHICVRTPSGPVCRCKQGYSLRGDAHSCEDVKECARDPPLCSQVCLEAPGTFHCDCYEGFILRPNKRSCKAMGEKMSLVFTAENQIRMLSQANNSLSILYSKEIPKITGLDVSTATGYVYFSIQDSGTLNKIHMRNQTKFFIPVLGQPEQIALDWISNNVYLINSYGSEKFISVCHFDSGKCATLKELDVNDHVGAFAVDPINKYIFYAVTQWWLFNSPHYTVYRCNLDGTKVHELLKTSVGFVSGFTYDSNKKILYFAEQYRGKIFSMNYDGSNQQNIISDLSTPRGLNMFEDHLFFFASHQFMQKCSLYGEERFCDTFKFNSYCNQLFVIAQESRQPRGVNVCENHSCSHLCIPSDVEVRCVCEDGSIVDEDKECPSSTDLRSADFKIKSRVQMMNSPANSTTKGKGVLTLSLLIPLCLTVFLLAAYYAYKKRRTGKFNVSIRFYNPGYGLEPDAPKPILQPGQHEYCNPVDFFDSDREASTRHLQSTVKLDD